MVQWDPKKAESNVEKHGVSFTEGTSVFDDPFSITIEDGSHSIGEARFATIGYSERNRLLVFSYTERVNDIRIITTRTATPAERKIYEQGL